MKKPQAVKFWKSLPMSTDVGEVIRGFANKKGMGGSGPLSATSRPTAHFKPKRTTRLCRS